MQQSSAQAAMGLVAPSVLVPDRVTSPVACHLSRVSVSQREGQRTTTPRVGLLESVAFESRDLVLENLLQVPTSRVPSPESDICVGSAPLLRIRSTSSHGWLWYMLRRS